MINERLSSEMQIQTYDHETRHIDNGDYDRLKEIDRLEYDMHVG